MEPFHTQLLLTDSLLMSLHISAQALCPHLRDPFLILLTWYSTVVFSKHCVPSPLQKSQNQFNTCNALISFLWLWDSKLHESRELFILITSVSFHTTGCLVHVRYSDKHLLSKRRIEWSTSFWAVNLIYTCIRMRPKLRNYMESGGIAGRKTIARGIELTELKNQQYFLSAKDNIPHNSPFTSEEIARH